MAMVAIDECFMSLMLHVEQPQSAGHNLLLTVSIKTDSSLQHIP